MAAPRMTLDGAHPLKFDDDPMKQFIEESWDDSISVEEKWEMPGLKRDELSSVAALDITVENADNTFKLSDFRRPESDRAACDEVYLTADDRSVDSQRNPKGFSGFRVYSSLHDDDIRKPLPTSCEKIRVNELAPLPGFLKRLHSFKPAV